MKSAACEIKGKSSIVRSPGSCLATVNTVGRKLPNKFKKPKPSRAIPIKPHLITTNAMPRKKQIVPLNRSRLWQTLIGVLMVHDLAATFRSHSWKIRKIWNKTYLVNSVIVRLIPIAKQRPAKKRLLPIAINDASNSRTTPRDTNPRPRQIKPIPIFWLSSSTISLSSAWRQNLSVIFCENWEGLV